MFNCGEGTQRLAHEHRTKLTRMEHIFLTRKTWNRVGGVPGLCLTLQEIGVPKLSLHGPAGIDDIFGATRKFVVLRNMQVDTPECNEGEFWEDSVLRVNYVPLYKTKKVVENVASAAKSKTDNESKLPNEKEQRDENKKDDKNEGWCEHDYKEYNKPEKVEAVDNTDYFGYEEKNRSNYNKFYDNDAGSTSNKNGNSHKMSMSEDHVMSYICKLQPRAGMLNLEKCVDAGVKPGPLLGRLKNGFDVTLPDGSVVKADDVRGVSCPGPVFIFIDIPSEEYFETLLNNERLKAHQSGAIKEDDVALVVVHFSSEEIMNDSRYQEWMNRFSPSTKHLIVNERNTFTGYFASHRIQRQLHELDKNVFPMLKEIHPYVFEQNDMAVDVSEIEENPAKKFKIDTGVCVEKLLDDKFSDYPELGVRSCFHLRPARGFDRFKEPYSHPDKALEETYVNCPTLPRLIEEFKAKSSEIVSRSKAERNNEFPKVITFGTGSCIPNKTRNVSANLVQVADDNCVIFDCGEGTLGQLVRFFSRDGADEILKNLRMIYISHLHADHHLGLINILNRRRKLTNGKVVLLAPNQIFAWLSFYNNHIEEIFSTFELVPCSDLVS